MVSHFIGRRNNQLFSFPSTSIIIIPKILNKIKEPAYEPEHGRNEQARYDSWGEERRSILLLVMQFFYRRMYRVTDTCRRLYHSCARMRKVVQSCT